MTPLERAERSIASRTGRRGFLGKLGRGVVALAGGGLVATALAPERASAHHICGHIASTDSCPHPFGRLARTADGAWDTSGVTGLPPQALSSTGASNPPSLILQPWHQVGNVVSLRQFTTNAFNHHHGMQAEERVGAGVDQDGDGLVNELTRADITAATLFQAAMAVPGRVIPGDPVLQSAILNGETLFAKMAQFLLPQPCRGELWLGSEEGTHGRQLDLAETVVDQLVRRGDTTGLDARVREAGFMTIEPRRDFANAIGATGAQEAIYSLLMMNNGFICESANITELDPVFADMPIVRKRIDNARLGTVLSNSFGFGGTNATLVFKRMDA